MIDIDVKADYQQTINISKGVIRTRELADISETEIILELRSQGITAVKRVKLE